MNEFKIAKVVHIIDQENIVINAGENKGIKIGDRFIIFGIGTELFDPDTKESLGRLELVRGEGVVEHVQEKMCIVKSDEYVLEPSVTEIKSYPNPLGMLTYSGVAVGEKKIVKPSKRTRIEFRNVMEGDFAKLLEKNSKQK